MPWGQWQLYEVHNEYEIYHHTTRKRRPWKAQVPDRPRTCAEQDTLESARAFIDNRLRFLRRRTQ